MLAILALGMCSSGSARRPSSLRRPDGGRRGRAGRRAHDPRAADRAGGDHRHLGPGAGQRAVARAAAAELRASATSGHLTTIQDGRRRRARLGRHRDEKLGRGAKRLEREDTRGEARARARVELLALPGSRRRRRGTVRRGRRRRLRPISDEGVEGAREGDSTVRRPDCASTTSSSSGASCRSTAATSARTRASATRRAAAAAHSTTGWHYKCGNSGAIDLNYDRATRSAIIDASVELVHKLGFSTLWQRRRPLRPHAHRLGTPARASAARRGGAAGPLQHTTLEVKLIDWDARVTDRVRAASSAARRRHPVRARRTRRSPRSCATCSTATTCPPRSGWRRWRRRSSSRASTTSPTATATRTASSSSGRTQGWGTLDADHGPELRGDASSSRGASGSSTAAQSAGAAAQEVQRSPSPSATTSARPGRGPDQKYCG